MAHYVKGRITAARAGLMMLIFGAGVGVGAKVNDDAVDRVDASPAASKTAAKNSIGSLQIKNHSLRLGDIKLHEVASYKEFKSFISTLKAETLLHKGEADGTFLHKGEAYLKGEADGTFLHKGEAYIKGEADATFLHKGETADNALKLDGLGADQIVQGHGQVVTGSLAVGNSQADVFILIGLLRASSMLNPANGQASVTLTNLSSQTLMINGDGRQQTASVPPGGTDTFDVPDGTARSLQVVVAGGNQVITLSLSSFAGNTKTLVGQALVGSF
jgi:hypothetical protein